MKMKLRKPKLQNIQNNNPYKTNGNYMLNYDESQDYDQVLYLSILNMTY